MDIKNVLWRNPLHPAYASLAAPNPQTRPLDPPNWTEHPGGLVEIATRAPGSPSTTNARATPSFSAPSPWLTGR